MLSKEGPAQGSAAEFWHLLGRVVVLWQQGAGLEQILPVSCTPDAQAISDLPRARSQTMSTRALLERQGAVAASLHALQGTGRGQGVA